MVAVVLMGCSSEIEPEQDFGRGAGGTTQDVSKEETSEVAQAAKASCSPSPQTKYTSGGWGWGGAHRNNCDSNGKTTSLQGASTVVPNQAGGCVCRTNDENLNYGTHCNTYINSGYWSVTWTCTSN